VLSFIEGGVVTCDFSSLDVIAANLGYNKEYMSRCFSQEIGMSVTRYLQTLRIDKARELLLETDYDINYISRLLGYRDVTHFIRTFKRYLGTTPEKFRRTSSSENALRYSFRIHGLRRDG
jgi:YesN/AraC family two-component response regulator